MFGGFGFFGAGVSVLKMFTLPPHYAIRVTFTFFKIDSWDNEMFAVYIDGRESFMQRFFGSDGAQVCG